MAPGRAGFLYRHCAAYLNNGDAGIVRGVVPVKAALDLIGDMRDHLYRAAAVIAPALLVKHRPVDFSGGYIGVFGQTLINKNVHNVPDPDLSPLRHP